MMGIIRRGIKSDPTLESLKARLIQELREGSPGKEPHIIIEGGEFGRPVRLYVVWKEWGDMSLEDRSQIILSAYQEVEGIEKVLEVTLAMGLRPDEAPRFGLNIEEILAERH
jgi:hypothetical protein